MARSITPATMAQPFSNYSHAIEIPAGARLLTCSGQLGVRADGTIPASTTEQAEVCFDNIRQMLAAADMTMGDVVHIRAFVTDRAHMDPYMQVRNALFPAPYPASTLMIVGGFSKPEFTVEIEVLAAKLD